jgi:hypothetical protein
MKILAYLLLGGGALTIANGIAMDLLEAVLFVYVVVALCKGWRPWKKPKE